MRYNFFLFLIFLTSCVTRIRTGAYDASYGTSTPNIIQHHNPRPFGWFWSRPRVWYPTPTWNYTPYYYTPIYVPPRPIYIPPRPTYVLPRSRTNLPLNSNQGPRGGRRK